MSQTMLITLETKTNVLPLLLASWVLLQEVM